VIAGASRRSDIVAMSNDGTHYLVERIAYMDPDADIAILKCDCTGVAYLQLELRDDAAEGQSVLVIGNPEGLQGTVSNGLVAAIRTEENLIQITAPISPGSSGSPVLNEDGRVVGVAVGIFKKGGQNLNFAIPVKAVRKGMLAISGFNPHSPDFSEEPLGERALQSRKPIVPYREPSAPPDYSNAKWPDDRMLINPEDFVQTYVINVNRNDTITLRGGPGTSFPSVAGIPPDDTHIIAFDQDKIWDGDTWWYPVVWHGLLGYVGGSHIAH
jgi:Trypsin-like peptidase domain